MSPDRRPHRRQSGRKPARPQVRTPAVLGAAASPLLDAPGRSRSLTGHRPPEHAGYLLLVPDQTPVVPGNGEDHRCACRVLAKRSAAGTAGHDADV